MPKNDSIDYETYKKERELLSGIENSNYQNFEKSILTLSSAFLAFSLSFLGLFSSGSDSGTLPPVITLQFFLVWSWILFGTSVVSILLNFLVSAMATRKEIKKVTLALKDRETLKQKNPWTSFAFVLYFISGSTFIMGLIFLIIFSSKNVFKLF